MKFEKGNRYILVPKKNFPPIPIKDVLDEIAIRCPNCKSINIDPDPLYSKAGEDIFECHDCGIKFDPEGKEK